MNHRAQLKYGEVKARYAGDNAEHGSCRCNKQNLNLGKKAGVVKGKAEGDNDRDNPVVQASGQQHLRKERKLCAKSLKYFPKLNCDVREEVVK